MDNEHKQGQGDESTPEATHPPGHHIEIEGPKSSPSSPLYPNCALCRNPIQNIIVQALDQTWHPEHFRCTHCLIPIGTQKFYVHNDNPYCVEDYAILFLKKCQGCKLPIKDVVVTALDQTWHPDHFVCVSCGSKLLYQGFYEKENNAFCTECFENKFCPKCLDCGEPITDTAIKVHSQKWHENCFKCAECRRPISGPTFQLCGEQVMCVECCGGEMAEKPPEEVKNDVVSYFEGSDDE